MGHYFINDDNIESNKKIINVRYDDKNIKVYSDNGVFSKEHFDYGSRILVDNFLGNVKEGRVLDLGCGYGIIGIILSLKSTFDVDMVDINKKAVSLTKENIKLNRIENANVFESDIYSNIGERYDYIITNPPIRAGKEVIRKFLFGGKNYLTDDGELWFVMRKDHGVKSMINELNNEYIVQIMDRNKGFWVIKLKKMKK